MTHDVSFFARPTPIDAAPRLAHELGLDPSRLLIKRDDLTGLGGGGNKVRKLEVTIAAALAAGAPAVVTTGAPQSNHARLTAAAAARCGLGCVLVLEGRPPAEPGGNLLLDELFGAEVVFAGDGDIEDVAAEQARVRGAYTIPFGGTSAESAAAYRRAGDELLRQVPDLGAVVTAVGSGGTMAGLVAALGTSRVLGVATGAVPDARATVASLLTAMGASTKGLSVDDSQIGNGYSHLTAATLEAMTLTARTEGIVLDPVYTGRAMAGLIALARNTLLPPGPVVFLHTGGLPGLFGHAEAPRSLRRATRATRRRGCGSGPDQRDLAR